MAEQHIAKTEPQKAIYVTPTIRTLDISELPEKRINALRIKARLRVQSPRAASANQSMPKKNLRE
jgi:hypothetical protein